MRDVLIERERDHASRLFHFRRDGRRDTAAISAFLAGSTGRVDKIFDQIGGHDLEPPATARGPLINPGVTTDHLPGLLFDNGGGFEGNPTAYGRPNYAVALARSAINLDLRHGFTIVAKLRVANEASIAGGQLLAFGPRETYPMLLLAGDPDPKRSPADAVDTTVLFGRLIPVAPALPSTPAILALAMNAHGFTTFVDGQMRTVAGTLPDNVVWHGLLLGTTIPGGGEGWELDSLLLFGARLSAEQIGAEVATLASAALTRDGATIVLDGSSVEAGVGSTALRNLTRLYEPALPHATIYNVAVGGARTPDRLRALPSTLALFRHPRRAQILICAVGANSLGTGVPAAKVYGEISRYVALAHAQVPGLKVGLATIIPLAYGLDAGFGASFPAYNAMVRENKAGADFIIDRAEDPIMANPLTVRPRLDRKYSTDGDHPTELGYRRLAAIDVNAILSELAILKVPP